MSYSWRPLRFWEWSVRDSFPVKFAILYPFGGEPTMCDVDDILREVFEAYRNDIRVESNLEEYRVVDIRNLVRPPDCSPVLFQGGTYAFARWAAAQSLKRRIYGDALAVIPVDYKKD